MTDTARTVIVRDFGGPEAMEIEQRPVGAPGKGEVRIRHHAGCMVIPMRTNSLPALRLGLVDRTRTPFHWTRSMQRTLVIRLGFPR